MEAVQIIPFGGCRINNPFKFASKNDSRLVRHHSWWVPGVYTFNEIVQIIDVWNGDVSIPADIAPWISQWKDRLVERPGLVAGAEVVLVETSSETEFSLDGFVVNRAAISDGVLKPIKAISKDAHRHMSKWYNNGLVGFDEDIRAVHSAETIKHIPDDFPDGDMLRRMVRDLRSSRADPNAGFRNILSRISVPVGYVNHVWQFMPDGRLMNWPAGYHEGVEEARRAIGIPLCSPEELVVAYGVPAAMRADFRHYSEEFMPLVANKLVDFAVSLRTDAKVKIAS